MTISKTKAISHIESKMTGLDESSLRYQTLQSAKRFKTSWVELGQYLHTVWREKHYKSWGYVSFESYCTKETGIRPSTALKLLRSYYFLERDEPAFLKEKLIDSDKVVELPNFRSVDILRLAKDKKDLNNEDYKTLRYSVLDKGEEPKEVRNKLKDILESYKELDPEEEKKKRYTTTINRFLSMLKNLQREIEHSGMLSKEIVKEVDQLIAKIEAEM
ncbi:MAG: hypothetical protein V3R78_02585 [Thermodesulfobacteriota bacterium]